MLDSRNWLPTMSAAKPVPIASNIPTAIRMTGETRATSIRPLRPPARMRNTNAAPAMRPPANPPPGALCPRSITYKETSSVTWKIIRVTWSKIIDSAPIRANGCRSVRRLRRREAATRFATPSAAMPNTVISPIVSMPRKSTIVTLTTFLPPASGSDSASILSVTSVGRSLLPAASANHADGDAHRDRETDAQGARRPRRWRRVIAWQVPEHEHERDDRHRLDHELGEGEVGRAVGEEDHREGLADATQEQHRDESATGQHHRERHRDREHGDGGLQHGIGDLDVTPAAGRATGEGHAEGGDDHAEHDGEVDGQ